MQWQTLQLFLGISHACLWQIQNFGWEEDQIKDPLSLVQWHKRASPWQVNVMPSIQSYPSTFLLYSPIGTVHEKLEECNKHGITEATLLSMHTQYTCVTNPQSGISCKDVILEADTPWHKQTLPQENLAWKEDTSRMYHLLAKCLSNSNLARVKQWNKWARNFWWRRVFFKRIHKTLEPPKDLVTVLYVISIYLNRKT